MVIYIYIYTYEFGLRNESTFLALNLVKTNAN